MGKGEKVKNVLATLRAMAIPHAPYEEYMDKFFLPVAINEKQAFNTNPTRDGQGQIVEIVPGWNEWGVWEI